MKLFETMNDNENVFIPQIEEIIKNYEDFRNNEKELVNSGKREERLNFLITRIKAIVKRITGNDSEYYKRIEEIFVKYEKFMKGKISNNLNTIAFDILIKPYF